MRDQSSRERTSGERRAADPREHPAEHVRRQRAVAERALAVAYGRARWCASTSPCRPGSRRPVVRAVVGDVDDRVLVDVEVPRDADAHVEHVLDSTAVPGTARELGQVVGDEVRRREQTAADEHAAEQRRERLRARHQEMRVGRLHAVEVPLGHDGAVVDHKEAVGLRLGEHLGQRVACAPRGRTRSRRGRARRRGSSRTGPDAAGDRRGRARDPERGGNPNGCTAGRASFRWSPRARDRRYRSCR